MGYGTEIPTLLEVVIGKAKEWIKIRLFNLNCITQQ